MFSKFSLFYFSKFWEALAFVVMAVPVDPAAADLVALANPAPPAAPVPAVVDAVLPAPPAPHVPPVGAAGGQQGQFNEVVFWFCVFFSFVLVFSCSYLHRLCVVSVLSHEVSLRVNILLFITCFFYCRFSVIFASPNCVSRHLHLPRFGYFLLYVCSCFEQKSVPSCVELLEVCRVSALAKRFAHVSSLFAVCRL